MSNDYVTGGISADTVLQMLYLFPLAPHYVENGIVYPGGRVHGHFGTQQVVFLLTPDDLTPWVEAWQANCRLSR